MEVPTNQPHSPRQHDIAELERIAKRLRKELQVYYLLLFLGIGAVFFTQFILFVRIEELMRVDDVLLRAVDRMERTR